MTGDNIVRKWKDPDIQRSTDDAHPAGTMEIDTVLMAEPITHVTYSSEGTMYQWFGGPLISRTDDPPHPAD